MTRALKLPAVVIDPVLQVVQIRRIASEHPLSTLFPDFEEAEGFEGMTALEMQRPSRRSNIVAKKLTLFTTFLKRRTSGSWG